jgi:hypothetical protein
MIAAFILAWLAIGFFVYWRIRHLYGGPDELLFILACILMWPIVLLAMIKI